MDLPIAIFPSHPRPRDYTIETEEVSQTDANLNGILCHAVLASQVLQYLSAQEASRVKCISKLLHDAPKLLHHVTSAHIKEDVKWSHLKKFHHLRVLHLKSMPPLALWQQAPPPPSSASPATPTACSKEEEEEEGLNHKGLKLLGKQCGKTLRKLHVHLDFMHRRPTGKFPPELVENIEELYAEVVHPLYTRKDDTYWKADKMMRFFAWSLARFVTLKSFSIDIHPHCKVNWNDLRGLLWNMNRINTGNLSHLCSLSFHDQGSERLGKMGWGDHLATEAKNMFLSHAEQLEVLDLMEKAPHIIGGFEDAVVTKAFPRLHTIVLNIRKPFKEKTSCLLRKIGQGAAANHLPNLHTFRMTITYISPKSKLDDAVMMNLAVGCPQLRELYLLIGVGTERSDLRAILKSATMMPSLQSLVIKSSRSGNKVFENRHHHIPLLSRIQALTIIGYACLDSHGLAEMMAMSPRAATRGPAGGVAGTTETEVVAAPATTTTTETAVEEVEIIGLT